MSIGVALGTVWAAAVVVGGVTGRAPAQAGTSIVAHVGNIKWVPGSVSVRADSETGVVTDVGNIKWNPGPAAAPGDSGSDVVTEHVGNIKWEPLG